MPTGIKSASTWLKREESTDRKNARVIDKLMVALPRELDASQRLGLVRRFLRRIGLGRIPWMAAIHDQGEDAHNPHAHILIRDRDIETVRRVAQLSEKGSTKRLRKLWEEEANLALQEAGKAARIDCRSLRDQSIDRQPQRHRGPSYRFRQTSRVPISSFPTALFIRVVVCQP